MVGELSVISFVSLGLGPGWTLEVSRKKLDEILSVPVETRTATNSLPLHAEISLQTVIRNFDSARRDAILQTKLRELELAQFRMAPQLAALTEGYRRALADYLGERSSGAPRPSWIRRVLTEMSPKASAGQTIKTLDALDARAPDPGNHAPARKVGATKPGNQNSKNLTERRRRHAVNLTGRKSNL